jgi:uncharacterized protein (DUF2235 family)
MPKRLVLLFDGTWNTLLNPKETTNVVRVGQAVLEADKSGTKQVVYYNSGVGSGGWWDQIMGGVFGAGVKSNVQRGLTFIAFNYNDGSGEFDAGETYDQIPDEIYIFGFSRGAYTARALAGVIGAIGGIPKVSEFGAAEKLWAHYRKRRRTEEDKEEIEKLIYKVPKNYKLIKCIAVWDTVGSYGIPSGLGLSGLARKLTSWTRNFRDNEIGKDIEFGLHAMAIDELRRAFTATAWVPRKDDKGNPLPEPKVEQVWFAGAHANVGGGYERAGLSDHALIWMMARLHEKTGLRFDDDYIQKHFLPCSGCSGYRSYRGWWLSRIWPSRRTIPRITIDSATGLGVPAENERRGILDGRIHWSVRERLGRRALVDQNRYAKYAPKNLKDAVYSEPTDEEKRLVDLCQGADEKINVNRKGCALRCSLEPPKEGGWWARWRERRRLRRIARMRKDWEGIAGVKSA